MTVAVVAKGAIHIRTLPAGFLYSEQELNAKTPGLLRRKEKQKGYSRDDALNQSSIEQHRCARRINKELCDFAPLRPLHLAFWFWLIQVGTETEFPLNRDVKA